MRYLKMQMTLNLVSLIMFALYKLRVLFRDDLAEMRKEPDESDGHQVLYHL